MNDIDTIADKLTKIRRLSEMVDLPWNVKRSLDGLELFGDQIKLSKEGDYISLDELKEVAAWLYKQCQTDTTRPVLSLKMPKKMPLPKELTAEQKRAFKKAVKKHVKQTKEHFTREYEPWKLDWSMIVSQVLFDTFDGHLSDYVWAEFHKAGLTVSLEDPGTQAMVSFNKEVD